MLGRIPVPPLLRPSVAAMSGSIALAALCVAAASDLSPKQLMRFGVDAARQGLWREAASRWEHAVKDDAKNPHLHNNLAVAYESVGRLDDADREYREARRLAPDSVEIRDNQESFLQIHSELRKPDDSGPPVPAAPGTAPASGTPPSATPPAGTSPTAPQSPAPSPAPPTEAQPSPPPPDPQPGPPPPGHP